MVVCGCGLVIVVVNGPVGGWAFCGYRLGELI